MMTVSKKKESDDDDRPLPLSELKKWMSDDVYLWIIEGDEKQQLFEKELEENAAMNASNLFGDANSASGNADSSAELTRLQYWSSSSTSPDGVGGFERSKSTVYMADEDPEQIFEDGKDSDDDMRDGVEVVFLLSDSYQGFGDVLWSSARHVANKIADPTQCKELLSPLFSPDYIDKQSCHHPLCGISFLEVGAGAGVPSWAAMKCGANVVCTDLSDTNRIRCMAECAERNFQQMIADSDKHHDKRNVLLKNASKTRVCPHDWGSPVDRVVKALNDDSSNETKYFRKRLFDVIIAADCCYMPWWHSELLDSIHRLLSDTGVAIIAFALHGNTGDDDVWKIVDRAKSKGFLVDRLESQQLTPPSGDMEQKQGLVHTIRLTKPV